MIVIVPCIGQSLSIKEKASLDRPQYYSYTFVEGILRHFTMWQKCVFLFSFKLIASPLLIKIENDY